jgi:acetylornithine/LysW-gamma-L-lysine aminotransferase
MSGYGVAIVGHCNPYVSEAIKAQTEKLITCHGSYYNEPRAKFLEKLITIAPKNLEQAFLSNSGAESVEAALKIARKHTGKSEIVAMTGSYHGKTMGALSATWTQRYREPFQPLLPEIKFTQFGNSEEANKTISSKTAAVIVEPVQGETGIRPAPDGFLQDLREICDKNNSLLILDEIQTGFGRTGKMWASEHWKIEPDIMCLSKAIAGGLPMGATLARGEIMKSMKKGDHSTTFGGNPLACSAAEAVIDYIIDEGLVDRAEKIGSIFKEGLNRLVDNYRLAREARGLGLMLALEMRFNIKDMILKGLNEKVIMLYSGKNILRFLPPLVISEGQIKKVLDILRMLIEEEEKTRFEN